jgi:hypothetical protein
MLHPLVGIGGFGLLAIIAHSPTTAPNIDKVCSVDPKAPPEAHGAMQKSSSITYSKSNKKRIKNSSAREYRCSLKIGYTVVPLLCRNSDTLIIN